MENLIQQKIQELEQLRHNLLQNIRCSDEPARAYQQMSLEVVEGCQEVLRKALETLKSTKNVPNASHLEEDPPRPATKTEVQ